MTVLRLKYVDRFTDRHGRQRHYFRRNRGARIPLPGLPGSAEYTAAYQDALSDEKPRLEAKWRGSPGTFARLAQDYYASADFARLRPATAARYRQDIDKLVHDESISHRLVRQMRRQHVSVIVAKRRDRPGAANDALKKLRILLRFAIANDWRKDDPTFGVKGFDEIEHHTWTEDEIGAFEAHWPIGTKQRTAFALLLHTGQRLGDVRRMSWRDLDGPGIQVVQGKTKTRLWIPLHADLAAVLDAWPREHVAILVTHLGEPYSAKGAVNWMAVAIDTAGLPARCVTHGLRKAAARRLAEAGCTEHQIMAITGHQSLSEVERYTRAANQRQLARDAISKLGRNTNNDSQT
jgi:integrase